jgi:hypothetical protein
LHLPDELQKTRDVPIQLRWNRRRRPGGPPLAFSGPSLGVGKYVPEDSLTRLPTGLGPSFPARPFRQRQRNGIEGRDDPRSPHCVENFHRLLPDGRRSARHQRSEFGALIEVKGQSQSLDHFENPDPVSDPFAISDRHRHKQIEGGLAYPTANGFHDIVRSGVFPAQCHDHAIDDAVAGRQQVKLDTFHGRSP